MVDHKSKTNAGGGKDILTDLTLRDILITELLKNMKVTVRGYKSSEGEEKFEQPDNTISDKD